MTTTMALTPARSLDHQSNVRPTHFLAVALAVIAIRALVFGTGLVALHVASPSVEPEYFTHHPWMAFDARAYRDLSYIGYSKDKVGLPWREGTTFSLIAYFPIVPLVGQAAKHIMSVDVALLLFSNLSGLIGLIIVYDWARKRTDEGTAIICTLLIATFPGAVSIAAGQTEGPFFLVAALVFWLMDQKRYWSAAIVAGVGAAIRPTGIALSLIIPLLAWFDLSDLPAFRRITIFVALGFVSGSGLLCYELFLWHRYHTPFAYFQAQTHWNDLDTHRQAALASSHVNPHSLSYKLDALLLHPQGWNRILAVGIFVILLIGLFKKSSLPRITFLFPMIVLLMTSLPGHGLRISSVPRYESAALPMFLLIALWLTKKNHPKWVGILLLFQLVWQLYYATLFPRQIWVG